MKLIGPLQGASIARAFGPSQKNLTKNKNDRIYEEKNKIS